MTGPLLAVVLVLCAALGAAGVLVVLGAGKLGRSSGDDMAIADATRECTACSPADWGACTCAEPCGVIRCTAWDDAITPGQLRLIRDTEDIKEN